MASPLIYLYLYHLIGQSKPDGLTTNIQILSNHIRNNHATVAVPLLYPHHIISDKIISQWPCHNYIHIVSYLVKSYHGGLATIIFTSYHIQ